MRYDARIYEEIRGDTRRGVADTHARRSQTADTPSPTGKDTIGYDRIEYDRIR